jgi:hypothetical protein
MSCKEVIERKIMAVIGIRKLIEIDKVGYYAVGVDSIKRHDFYMGINKKSRVIYFYETDDCSNPAISVDCNNDYKVNGELNGVDMRLIVRLCYLNRNVFQQEKFPDSDVWARCGTY